MNKVKDIEARIEAIFGSNPALTFTDLELAGLLSPTDGAIWLSAASAISARIHWAQLRCEHPDGPSVFCNKLDLRSYAVGRLRADFCYWNKPVEELEMMLFGPTAHPKRHLVGPTGLWTRHVELARQLADCPTSKGDLAG